MPSLDFEVYCGICGKGVCNDTEVSGVTLTVTCSTCEDRLEDAESEKETVEKALEEAQERIAELEQELIDKVTKYEGRTAAISYGYTKDIDTSI